MRTRSGLVVLVALLMVVVTATAEAQRRGQGGQGRGQGGPGRGGQMFGRGGGFMGGGGGGLLGLARNEAVQKEIEMIEDQVESVNKLSEEMRGERPNFGNFRDMSDEERQKMFADMQKRREEQAKVAKGKLAEILLPHQMDRLEQINIQQMGVGAVMNAEVAAKLKISAAQKEKMQSTMEAEGQKMREQMGALFRDRGGDREQMREKMTAMRKELEDKVMAHLTDDQKKQLDEMKGEPFDMPRPDFGGRGGQRGGQRGQGGGGDRPQRPQRPDA